METRIIGYLGLGALIGIVVATLIGVPPVVWITVTFVAVVAIGAVTLAQSKGDRDAARAVAAAEPEPKPSTGSQASTRSSSVEMVLVRPSDEAKGTPAVWLHRRGGRRVHRFESSDGWVVQRVSTKDPDNPKSRVIGDVLIFASETEAITAADELAQGQAPPANVHDGSSLAVAKASP